MHHDVEGNRSAHAAIWPFELGNALVAAERGKRITVAQGTTLLRRIVRASDFRLRYRRRSSSGRKDLGLAPAFSVKAICVGDLKSNRPSCAFTIQNDYYDHNADSAEAANEHADMDGGRGEG